MGIFGISAVSLAVMSILGCSSHQSPDPPPPPPKTVFDPLTQQLGRAKDVQNTVDANTENMHKAVDSQERGDSPP
ncbi:MAG: hypothetical protein QOI88_1864 [Gammaproteobacteria bacterium]|jgi:hypothetical protein|nr:hypothetical protein [Gammaproteobacteria bacterium]